jgi:hypothetical protein
MALPCGFMPPHGVTTSSFALRANAVPSTPAHRGLGGETRQHRRCHRGAAHRAQYVANACSMDATVITYINSSPSDASIAFTRRPFCRGYYPPRARPTRPPPPRHPSIDQDVRTAPLTADAPRLMRDVYSGIILYLVVCPERGWRCASLTPANSNAVGLCPSLENHHDAAGPG